MTQIADEAAEKAVKKVLLTLGVNADNPIEMQKDMIALRELRILVDDSEIQQDLLYLRSWRKTMQAVKSKGILTAVGMIVTAILAALWFGFNSQLGG